MTVLWIGVSLITIQWTYHDHSGDPCSSGGLFASESLCKTIHELFTLVFCVQNRLHIAPPKDPRGVRCTWKYGKVKPPKLPCEHIISMGKWWYTDGIGGTLVALVSDKPDWIWLQTCWVAVNCGNGPVGMEQKAYHTLHGPKLVKKWAMNTMVNGQRRFTTPHWDCRRPTTTIHPGWQYIYLHASYLSVSCIDAYIYIYMCVYIWFNVS